MAQCAATLSFKEEIAAWRHSQQGNIRVRNDTNHIKSSLLDRLQRYQQYHSIKHEKEVYFHMQHMTRLSVGEKESQHDSMVNWWWQVHFLCASQQKLHVPGSLLCPGLLFLPVMMTPTAKKMCFQRWWPFVVDLLLLEPRPTAKRGRILVE